MDSICETKRVYTAEQIAIILDISVRSVYYLCESTDKFKVLRLGRRLMRIDKESFDQWFHDGCT